MFQNKQSKLFFDLIEELPQSLDETFRKECQNLLKYHEDIALSILLPYLHGKLEDRNTHIKPLKRFS